MSTTNPSVTQQYLYILMENKIVVEQKSDTHLVVEGHSGYIDVWPTTGKWKPRYMSAGIEGFGLRNLLNHLTEE